MDPAEALIETIRRSVIGDDEAVAGPFGIRRVTYADYTASGRSLAFIEDYLRDAVLPLYANTHTESSGTGLQTTRFRAEARELIRRAVGATDEHAVIFVGSGSTGAINRLVDVLQIRLPANLDDRYGLRAMVPPAERPLVLVGPYEHHSNELPWRESLADVVVIHEDHDGQIDAGHLAVELERHADRALKIGSFSAASNVTGILSDVRGISALLHAHGALACWDYAAAAPYVAIDMAGDGLDAIFVSPHKFIGGPGTPGLLVARKTLFRNRVPSVPGGGTVAYVNPAEHLYLTDVERREEGGTPAIVESIRAGLVFGLKEAVGVEAIREREESFIHRAIARWSANPNLEILGNPHAERLSIVSFVVRHQRGDRPARYLHHNYVVALLNDLFGIQARGGCSCAGPYGHRLLGIDLEHSRAFEREIARGCEGIKPGWVRVNFNYFISGAVFAYILDAVDLVASDGWRLLPEYRFDPVSGLWGHRGGVMEPPLSLGAIRYDEGVMRYAAHRHREPESRLADYLAEARRILADPPPPPDGAWGPLDVGADFEHLRWFWLPSEAADELAAEELATRVADPGAFGSAGAAGQRLAPPRVGHPPRPTGPTLREGVADLDAREATVVAVARPDRPHVVLQHQRDQVRVEHQIPGRHRVIGNLAVADPEALLLPGGPDVRAGQQLLGVADRLGGGQRPREDSGVGRDPQVGHDGRPEEVGDLRAVREALDERAGPGVNRARLVRRVQEDVRVDRVAHEASSARRSASGSSRSTRARIGRDDQASRAGDGGSLPSACSAVLNSSDTRRPRVFPSRR
jgi:selenocysteine lyase/cysteine desulfurase